jgi:flagellar hook-associated protein 1 FlgK
MSLTEMMNIARSALLTQQAAMAVTGHNIANANTPGYSRQTARLAAATPLNTPIGTIGRGVTLVAIDSARNEFLNGQIRTQSGTLGYSNSLRDSLSQVENVYGEPSDSGLGSGIDGFLSAWNDVANDPSAQTPRNLLRQSAQALVDQFHSINNQLGVIAQNVHQQIAGAVDQVNAIATQIAQLNSQIQSSKGTGAASGDLSDQRDQLIDQLSQLVDTRVVQHDDGTVGVIAGSTLLVDASQLQKLQTVDLGGGQFGVGIVGQAGTIDPGAGSIKGLVQASGVEIPAAQARLDTLAATIVSSVNTLHQAGTTTGGATNVAFFNPAGTTAATIGLSAQVQASLNNIVAGTTAATGDGAVAQQISQLSGTAVAALGGQTLRGYYNDSVSDIAGKVSAASVAATSQSTLVSSLDSQRSSETGVSVDEELTRMIEQQQAFSAAAKMVNVADEMMQTILTIVS